MLRLHEPTFGEQEIEAVVEVMRSTQVTMGRRVKQLEREFCAQYGAAHGVSCNSGSSANLLAIAALTNPVVADGLRPGDEVIVPALCWSTTVWPLVQHGLVPVIVDVDRRTFNIDPNEIERAITEKTRAIMCVHVYGNPCNISALEDIRERHDLLLIEDCCEALGARYGNHPVGVWGNLATFSFYFSHHMTTIEGGIVTTFNQDAAELMRVLRAHGWTRDMEAPPQTHLDPRFTFINQGYNLRLNELQAAIGLVQLPKLDSYVALRRATAHAWLAELEPFGQSLEFQVEEPKGASSWFGFPVVVREEAPCMPYDIKAALNEAGVETRPIICGNIALQPGMQLYPHRVVGDLTAATRVMRNGFSWGNHQSVTPEQRELVRRTIAAALVERKTA